MDGKALAAKRREAVALDVAELGHVGLATVLVGDDPASHVYINAKHKASTEAGIEAHDHRLSATALEEEVLELVARLNADDAVDGILVQLPLPAGMDEAKVIRSVAPVKDVDGFHPLNAGQLLIGEPTHVPATPLGVLALLDEYGVELKGANAVVIGRSQLVGKPVALLLLARHATVTICHSRTAVLRRTRGGRRAVASRRRSSSPEMVKRGGRDRRRISDRGGTRRRRRPGAAARAGLMTPVPGGVGPMTIAMLLENTVRAARYRRGLLAFPGASV